MTAFFSIVVPVYERFDLLKETIGSILKQSFPNYELIIVDDGSDDNTLELCQNNYGRISNVRIISQLNSERAATRNNGFRHASGSYVVFFDSDDLMHPNHLSTLYHEISIQNFPNFITTKFNILGEKGKIVSSKLMSLTSGYYDYKTFLSGNHLACNFSVKKNNPDLKLFEEDRKYAIKEDWMFLLSNLRHNKLYLSDTVTVTLRDHSGRSMRSDNKLIIQKTWWAVEWIKEHVELTDEDKTELDAHANYFSAIHSYTDYDRVATLKYLRNAAWLKGWNKKYFVLLLKALVGHRLLSKLR